MPYKNKEDRKQFDARRATERKLFFSRYLREHPCVDCGESNLCVLEFDHVRGEKLFNVRGHTSKNLHQIEEEIKKCDVRCANCHSRRHKKGCVPSGEGVGL